MKALLLALTILLSTNANASLFGMSETQLKCNGTAFGFLIIATDVKAGKKTALEAVTGLPQELGYLRAPLAVFIAHISVTNLTDKQIQDNHAWVVAECMKQNGSE